MKIRTKLTFAIAVLVIVIVAQGIICNIFLYRFTDASKKILKDNYASVEYCKEMIRALDNIQQNYIFFELHPNDTSNVNWKPDFNKSKEIFEKHLKAEENNITEPGEKEEVETLRISYQEYISLFQKAKPKNLSQGINYLNQLTIQYGKIKNDIISIWNINMNAITRKNTVSEGISHEAILYTSFIEFLALIIVLPFLFLFPSYIARPIKEMIAHVKEISNKNFSQRIVVRRKDELGELAEEINNMADKLNRHG